MIDMRLWAVTCGLWFVLAACGSDSSGLNDDDGSGGGGNPRVDAATDPNGGDGGGGGGGGDGGGSGSGSDAATPPQPIANGCPFIERMSADSTHLFWACTSGNSSTVKRMPLQGGTIETLYNSTGWVAGLAVVDGFVYVGWSGDAITNYAGAIVRFPVTGGTPTTLATPIGVRALDVDGGVVYFADTPGATTTGEARIMRMPTTGGTQHFVVRVHANSTPYEMRAGASTVFYSDSLGVARVDVQTKQSTDLVTNMIAPQLTIDDQFVYFVGCTGMCTYASAYRIPRGGGAVEQVGLAFHGVGSRIAVIDDSLLWGSYVLSTTDGSERTLLASPHSFAVAATPQAFYFGDRVTGDIYRVER